MVAARPLGCHHCTGVQLLPLQSPRQRRQQATVAAAAGGPPPSDRASQPPLLRRRQPQQQSEFDIVSGSKLPEAQGPTCDWPRLEQRRRWAVQDSPLVTTGFPVPSGYGSGAATLPPASGGMLWRLRNPERQPARAAPADAGHAAGSLGAGSSPPLVPVYRSAPYRAEAARQRRPSPTARILFLDEGCGSRAVLAAALLQAMLRKLSAPLDAEVTAASVGPPLPGGHDERVAAVAREMDVTLQPRHAREFDEMRDTPAYDLILVMDRYDEQEVLREVSVLERLNPGAAYLTRVHRLNEFARAGQLVFKDRCLLVPEDVPDPFYGLLSAADELASLRSTAHAIALGCRGLLAYLLKLRSRCGCGGAAPLPLRVALAQSLQCPLMDPTSRHALSALVHCQLPGALPEAQRRDQGQAGGGAMHPARPAGWAAHTRSWPRPVWLGSGNDGDDEDEEGADSDAQRSLWTVRDVAGQQVVVRRARPGERAMPHGYWTKVENVELELSKWMERSGRQDRLPTQRELRRSGANTLSAKVDSHGGLAVFAERMGLPLASGRAPNGQWADFGNLATELRRFVTERQPVRDGYPAGGGLEAHTPAGGQPSVQQQLQQQHIDSLLQQQHTEQQPQFGQAKHGVAHLGNLLTTSRDGSSGGGSSRRRNMRFASRSWSSVGPGSGLSNSQGAAAVMLLAPDGSATDGGAADSSSATDPAAIVGGSNSPAGMGSPSPGSEGGEPVFLPTQQELRAAGRADLIGAIRANGGSLEVARRLGWLVHHGRLPSEGVVVQQLLDFAERAECEAGGRPLGRRATPLPMPTLRQLQEGGRADLASAVQRLGGCSAFAALLAAEQQRRQRRRQRRGPTPVGSDDATLQVAQELSVKPKYAPGGSRAAASLPNGSGGPGRPEARTPPQPAVVRVGEAVAQLIEARGWEPRVPTKQELVAAGRRDLAVAIARCGGAQKLAEHLQLPYTEMRGRRKQREQTAAGSSAGGAAGRASEEGAACGGAARQPELDPSFVAARLRRPPGLAVAAAEAAEGSTAGSGMHSAPAGGRPHGPASVLLERELIVDAYNDVTFV